jgi:16S rRNA (uracil1498-N3)-methyltransferase
VNLFYQPLIQEGIKYLDPSESKHSTRVLRKKIGDRIYITDGKGFLYTALITEADADRCFFEIQERVPEAPKKHAIHIAISPTKHADRFEWFVEKAVELGIDRITLMECDHTEYTHLKSDRLEKIAISAMKQSVRFTLPSISRPIKMKDVVDNPDATSQFIAYVDPGNPYHLKNVAKPNSDYLVLIGPEGDFSEEELNLAQEKKFQRVSLGSNRLRTETAGVAACHILNLVNTP